MRLFLFNPDHDMALAANYPAYIAKTAGQQLMRDMAWLPACYAETGDAVLLLDAPEAIPEFALKSASQRGIRFLHPENIPLYANQISEIAPWGWNRQIVNRLQKHCPSIAQLLPTDLYLQTIRQYSSRRYAADNLLKRLIEPSDGLFVGEAEACLSIDQLLSVVQSHASVVAKEPWSGSGRGLRYLEGSMDKHQLGWCHRVIKQQGCLMVEPHYQRQLDMAAEFHIDASGMAHFDGISIFLTHNGQYQGNLIASTEDKQRIISRLIDYRSFEEAINHLLRLIPTVYEGYHGPLGIDMMIVSLKNRLGYTENKLHPMVEVNLRQTMGHLALHIKPTPSEAQLLSIVVNNGHYELSLKPYTYTDMASEGYW